eukprot:2630200-Pyramimonas_sp.AAC.1
MQGEGEYARRRSPLSGAAAMTRAATTCTVGARWALLGSAWAADVAGIVFAGGGMNVIVGQTPETCNFNLKQLWMMVFEKQKARRINWKLDCINL